MIYNEVRPTTFDEMKGQDVIVNNIKNQSKKREFFSVYILGGQFGAGKTSMARIITLAANCSHVDENGNPCLECENCKAILNNQTPDVIELDAASNTGVDSIRDLIETASYLPSIKKKIYIIDEVHMLSKGAFNCLLKTLEEPPEHCIFILCTTDMNAIPATVRSRAAKYYFGQIKDNDIIEHLKQVCEKYDIHADDNVYKLIAKNSSGSLRNALALLEQASKIGNPVIAQDVQEMLGVSDPKYVFELLNYMLAKDTSNCIKAIEKLTELGKDLFLLVSDMLDICADGVVAACSSINDVCNTEYYEEQLSDLLSHTNQKQICLLANELIKVRSELRTMPTKTTLVVEVVRITTDIQALSNNVIQRLEYLENKLNDSTFTYQENNVTKVIETCKETETLELTANKSTCSESSNEETKSIVMENTLMIEDVENIQFEVDAAIDLNHELEEHQEQELDDNSSKAIDNSIKVSTDSKCENYQESEDSDNEIKNDTKQEIDIFDIMDLFGKIDKSSEKSENHKQKNSSDKSCRTENISESKDKVLVSEDSFLKDDLNNSQESRKESNVINEEENGTQIESENTLDENFLEQSETSLIKNHMQHIETLYSEFPLLESAIELGCNVKVVDEKVILYTNLKPIYDIINTIVINYSLQINIAFIE